MFNRRFYVRTIGWVKINEQDSTAEKSRKAVNKCIHDLSHGFKDYNDVVARRGSSKSLFVSYLFNNNNKTINKGKDLSMDFEDDHLVLIDRFENKVLNKQAITSIRVWVLVVIMDCKNYFIFKNSFLHDRIIFYLFLDMGKMGI